MALEQMTGLCKPFSLARKMGVNLTNPNGGAEGAAERVPNFPLGVADATPLEMAEAYATFAARGVHCDARPVAVIHDANGTTVKQYSKKCDRAIPAPPADAVNDLLRGSNEAGGFVSQNNPQPNQPPHRTPATTPPATPAGF